MADDFLELWARDPAAGRAAALAAVESSRDPVQLAFAHRTLGVHHRESGEPEAALAHLGSALRHARSSGDASVATDIMATRGGTHFVLGNPRLGLRDLSTAARSAEGAVLGTILYRRGVGRLMIGEVAPAAADAAAALDLLRRYEESAWVPRTLLLLGECEARRGHLKEAAECLAECYELIGDDAGYESIRLRTMSAWLAFLQGDVPTALARYRIGSLAEIEDGRLRAQATLELATVYLAAGLNCEAIEVLEAVEPRTVPATAAAELAGLLARSLLAAGECGRARDVALEASGELQGMGMRLEAAEAALTALDARVRIGEAQGFVEEVQAVARDLAQFGSRLAVDGWVLAGALATREGLPSRASQAYIEGAAYRRSTDLLVASSGWLSYALRLEMRGEPAVLGACGRGLDALEEYRDIMGSSEMRASMTHRGRELTDLALRQAAHSPRTLLAWSERWRATSLAQRPVTPHGEASPAVAMLRDSDRLIAEARARGESTQTLERKRRSLERRVRAEHHQLRVEGEFERRRFDPAELVAKVGDAGFLQIVEVDGILHILVVSKGRVRRVIAGETKATLELAEAGRFALRRAARTGRFAPGDLGERFQEAVLGKAVRMLPDGPVTISPTAALHGAPFALMPALRERPFSIVPSAAQWLRAREVPMPRTKRRAFVAGPGLLTGGAEVARLAAEYPDATVLRGGDATVAATMKAIDGAKLAHLATHGTFRADSPLFSALEMADGQLSVYELERLKRAPYRTILSACDSGVLAPVGAQEVLGLASALFSLGSAGLVCSIAEVNDEATADLMMQVHASVEAKRTPAEALADVRAAGSPVEQATAAAFVALGV